MLITTIIVSYNTAKLTQKAVLSVLQESKKHHLPVEIIVVDNASSDNSVTVLKQLKRKYRQLKLILNKANLGFAKANNQAIKQATGEYIFLLNSDAYLLPNALARLIKAFKLRPKLGIVSPLLLTPTSTLQNVGGDLPSLSNLACQLFFIDDLPLLGDLFPSPQKKVGQKVINQSFIPFGWVAGTAMMIKNEVIDQVGLLDEQIFMYAEDIDFCFRARQHQFEIGLVPQAKVIHYGSASGSNAKAILGEFQGLLFFFKKHKPTWQLPVLKAMLITGAWLRVVLFSLLGQAEKAKIYHAVADNLVHSS